MAWDDDDDENDAFGFNYDDLSPEEKEELDREMRELDERIHNHPLYIKAGEIYDIVHSLIETLPEADGREMMQQILMEDSSILQPKVAGAMGSQAGWYIWRMPPSSVFMHNRCLHKPVA